MITRTERLVEQAAQHTPQPNPLWDVFRWELFRMAHNRWGWLVPIVVLLGGISMHFLVPTIDLTGYPIFIYKSSAQDLSAAFPVYVIFFILVVPFLIGDMVARDPKRRMHEVLMATAVPTWAYIWGRYLAGAMVSMSLSGIFVAGALFYGWIKAVSDTHSQASFVAQYLASSGMTALLLWVCILLPRVFLFSGLIFALTTLLPRAVDVIKPIAAVAWIGSLMYGAFILLPRVQQHIATTHATARTLPALLFWDPTPMMYSVIIREYYTAITAQVLQTYNLSIRPASNIEEYQQLFRAVQNIPRDQYFQITTTLSNYVPDVTAWVPSALVFSILGMIAVALSAVMFRRFRDVLN